MKPSVHSVRDGRVCLNIKCKEHLSQINVYLKYKKNTLSKQAGKLG